jgi:hypothetical protein
VAKKKYNPFIFRAVSTKLGSRPLLKLSMFSIQIPTLSGVFFQFEFLYSVKFSENTSFSQYFCIHNAFCYISVFWTNCSFPCIHISDDNLLLLHKCAVVMSTKK